MKPWFDVLGVDKQAPWPLIEHTYLDKWALLKSKAFPTETEKQQLDELETAFRQAKQDHRPHTDRLTDASAPDGAEQFVPPTPEPEAVSEEEPAETSAADEENLDAEEVTEPEEDPEPVGCLAGYGTAIIAILGLALLLLGMTAMGISMAVAGLMLVFGIPMVLILASDIKKRRKKRNIPLSATGLVFLLLVQALASVAVFWVGSRSKINVFVLLLFYALGFVPFLFRKTEPSRWGWMLRSVPALLLSTVLFLNFFWLTGEPHYEQYRFANNKLGRDRNVILLENDAYLYMPGMRVFFDNDMQHASHVIYVFRQGLLGIPVRETYYLLPFYLKNISDDPLKNIQAVNEDKYFREQKTWTVEYGPGAQKLDSLQEENLKRLLRDSLKINN